jgi:signal transduction histidine kinase/ActR/RegA family two-component response regulator
LYSLRKRHSFLSLVHPEDRARVLDSIDRTLRGEQDYQAEFRILPPDGNVRWVAAHGQLFRDAAGAPLFLAGADLDITERKQAAEQVASMARFALENPNPVLRFDRDGRLLFANKASDEMLKVWGVAVGGTAPDFLRNLGRGALAAGRQEALEVPCGERLFLFDIVPVPAAGYVNIYGRDTTEHRRLEEQLRQSQKMEAIGRLAGGVAHDFNNLLTAIQGYGELILRRGPEDAPHKRHVEQILDAASRAASLTSQLLAFSRRTLFQPRVLDINSAIADTGKLLRRLIGEDVELVYRLAPDAGNVRTDPGQLGQVILNLAVNARDAMPRGGRLTLETSRAGELGDGQDVLSVPGFPGAKPGPYVCLAVSDTGAGMSPEVQEHLFEPFFTTKEHGKGTGLGLSTVYGIVTQSGGYIRVRSEAGRGSTFRVYLPRVSDPLQEAPRLAASAVPSGHETILLAEDAPEVRESLRRSLEGSGYRVLAAPDPNAALLLAEDPSGPAQLLIADVVMPGMNGRELARRLTTRWPALRVLFISGYADSVAQQDALEPGQAFLRKPFSMDDLGRKVREVLDAPSAPTA